MSLIVGALGAEPFNADTVDKRHYRRNRPRPHSGFSGVGNRIRDLVWVGPPADMRTASGGGKSQMDQVSYFRSHPPRCIAGFTSTPVALPGVTFDGHGSLINSVFSLTCSCGSGQHLIHGF